MRRPNQNFTQVDLELDGPVAHVVFSGPRGIQTLSAETRRALLSTLGQIDDNSDIRLVCFTGVGRTFFAGADVHEFLDLTPTAARELAREGQQLMTRIANLKPVTLAAINGACVGGGLELALACDLRIAKPGCKLGFPETRLGLLPCWGGTVRTTLFHGAGIAQSLILSGELISAEQAQQWGVVSECCPSEDNWEHFVAAWQQRILQAGPAGVSAAQRVIRRTAATISAMELGFADEAAAFVECVKTGQVVEGVNAFLEKREANW